MKFVGYFAVVLGLLMVSAPLMAHHGTGVAYEVDKLVTVKGTVTDWLWSNPHCEASPIPLPSLRSLSSGFSHS